MRTNTLRLVAAEIAYASGMVLVAQAGTAALATVAAATTSARRTASDALSTTVVAVLGSASNLELLTAALVPLALVAVAAVVWLIVRPAIEDHVPNTEPGLEDVDAEVLTLHASRRPSARREAA